MHARGRRHTGLGFTAAGALLLLSACSPVYSHTLESAPTSREALITKRVREASDAQHAALAAIESLRQSTGPDQTGGASRESLAACEQRIWEARKSLASVEDVAGPSTPAASAEPAAGDLANLLAEARVAAASLEALDAALRRRLSDPASTQSLDPRLDAARAAMGRFVAAADTFLAHSESMVPVQ